MASIGINQRDKKTFLHMPVEIIAIIIHEWTMLEWFAPAIARKICRYLKEITDASPHAWSKLFLRYRSPATPDGVRDWLKRAKSVPKEIIIDTENYDIALAALEGAKDATSLIYVLPTFKEIPSYPEELIWLRIQMPRLRHLVLNTLNLYSVLSPGDTYNPFHGAHLPCLTILKLIFVDSAKIYITPGQLPAIRRLALHSVYGPILDLIQACSGTVEHLIVRNSTHERQSYPHGRICLPNLKVLTVAATVGIVSNLEAPTLRLIQADHADMDGNTRPFSSVVEWVTRPYYHWRPVDITDHLTNMPKLQHLMISQHIETIKLCFVSLRDNRRLCPDLQSIEVNGFRDKDWFLQYKLDSDLMEFLKACVAWRAEEVPGFTLQFVDDYVQATRHVQSYVVGLFIIMHHYLSHHAF